MKSTKSDPLIAEIRNMVDNIDNTTNSIEPVDQKYYNHGCDLINSGKYQEALICFKKAINESKKKTTYNSYFKNYTYYLNKASVLEKLEKYKEALKSYQEAIAWNPASDRAHFKIGCILEKFDTYKTDKKALYHFSKAIEYNDQHYAAYFNKGCLLEEYDKDTEALKYLDNAVKLNPKFHFAYYYRGLVLNKQGRYTEALENFEKTIVLDPNFFPAYKYKVLTLYVLDKKKAALIALNKYKIDIILNKNTMRNFLEQAYFNL